LGIGEAVVTVMNERGAPTPVAWTRLRAPESLMGPADAAAMQATVTGSPLHAKYSAAIDRDSAHERLAAKVEAGAEKAEEEAAATRTRPDTVDYPKPSSTTPRDRRGEVVTDIVNSPVAKDLMRTAAREIFRGIFGTARR